MNARPEVTCIGEAIVDFVSLRSGLPLSEAPGFLKLAGGAAANVAIGLARLRTRSAFVGRVGDDSFGHFLAMAFRSICRYANAAGALTALKRGAAAAMPTAAQVERFIRT